MSQDPAPVEHELDPATGFCTHCGSHEELIVAEDLICCGGPNIIAFSHRRARQLIDEKRAVGVTR